MTLVLDLSKKVEPRVAVGVAGKSADAVLLIREFAGWKCSSPCPDMDRPLGSGGIIVDRGVRGDSRWASLNDGLAGYLEEYLASGLCIARTEREILLQGIVRGAGKL